MPLVVNGECASFFEDKSQYMFIVMINDKEAALTVVKFAAGLNQVCLL